MGVGDRLDQGLWAAEEDMIGSSREQAPLDAGEERLDARAAVEQVECLWLPGELAPHPESVEVPIAEVLDVVEQHDGRRCLVDLEQRDDGVWFGIEDRRRDRVDRGDSAAACDPACTCGPPADRVRG